MTEELKKLFIEVTPERLKEMSVKKNRTPLEEFPERLPDYGLKPLPVDEHEHIGMYESKQTLYLTMAHAFNKVMVRIEQLEDEVKKLKSK